MLANPGTTKEPGPTQRGTYRAHRERQRGRILAAAQEAFNARGIDRVLLSEIVAESGIRASTLYEYFRNKDEIVWALVERILTRSQAEIRQKVEATGETVALVRISALLDAFREELVQHPEQVRFMAQFDAMYARDWTVERLLALEDELSPGGFTLLRRLVEQGLADGSLRADLDPELSLHAVLNAVIGTQRRLASLGERVEQEYGRPIQDLFDEAVRVLLSGLRAA